MSEIETIKLVDGALQNTIARTASGMEAARKISSDFLLATLRSAFLLNGGALFALPAFLSALTKPEERQDLIPVFLSASGLFIFGIVCAALCGLAARRQHLALVDIYSSDGHKKQVELMLSRPPTDEQLFNLMKKELTKHQGNREESERTFSTGHRLVMTFISFSFLAFFAGCCVGGLGLLNAPGNDSQLETGLDNPTR